MARKSSPNNLQHRGVAGQEYKGISYDRPVEMR